MILLIFGALETKPTETENTLVVSRGAEDCGEEEMGKGFIYI